MVRTNKLEISDLIWMGFLGGLILSDIALLKMERTLLTTSARSHKILTSAILGSFALHVFDVLGVYDPYDLIGYVAGKRIIIRK